MSTFPETHSLRYSKFRSTIPRMERNEISKLTSREVFEAALTRYDQVLDRYSKSGGLFTPNVGHLREKMRDVAILAQNANPDMFRDDSESALLRAEIALNSEPSVFLEFEDMILGFPHVLAEIITESQPKST